MKHRILLGLILLLIIGCKNYSDKSTRNEFESQANETENLEKLNKIENTAEITEDQLKWKEKVLVFVHESLDSLYKIESIEDRVNLLKNYLVFIEENDNGNNYCIGPNSVLFVDWFNDLGYLKLFPELIRLDSLSNNFNGFEFFYRMKFMYFTMIENSEVISENLAFLAYRNPNKFLKYFESIEDPNKRQEIARTPYWHEEGLKEFKEKIKDSKYYNEIKPLLLN